VSLRSRLIALGLAAAVAAMAGWGVVTFFFTDSAPPNLPSLSASIRHDSIRVGEIERTYLFYVPATLSPHPGVLFVLHGARGTGRRMRVLTAYEFEEFADRRNFVIVYPDGFEGYWNDCRKFGSFAAKQRRVDDVQFIHVLVENLKTRFDVDSTRLFAMGFSNGGQMALRLAIELPDKLAGVAAVAANLPTAENSACNATASPLAVMIVNGTADPVNRYAGGPVGWLGWVGWSSSGALRSTMDTAKYFTDLAGYREHPQIYEYPRIHADETTSVERSTWLEDSSPEVIVYTIHGGGHTIPQANYRLRRILGATARDIDCMVEVESFVDRQVARLTSRKSDSAQSKP